MNDLVEFSCFTEINQILQILIIFRLTFKGRNTLKSLTLIVLLSSEALKVTTSQAPPPSIRVSAQVQHVFNIECNKVSLIYSFKISIILIRKFTGL